jgi:hypothetical protein
MPVTEPRQQRRRHRREQERRRQAQAHLEALEKSFLCLMDKTPLEESLRSKRGRQQMTLANDSMLMPKFSKKTGR